MGIAIRSKEYLALSIAPIIWKRLVGETPTVDDLVGINMAKTKSIERFRNIDKEMDRETFDFSFFESFEVEVTGSAPGTPPVELCVSGASKPVTFDNRHEWCDLTVQVGRAD